MDKVDKLFSQRYINHWVHEHNEILEQFKPFMEMPSKHLTKAGSHAIKWTCEIPTTMYNEHVDELPWDTIRPHILNAADELLQSYKPKQECNYEINVNGFWLNYYNRGTFQELHDHVDYGMEFSFAYMLALEDHEDSGQFNFYNDNQWIRSRFPSGYFEDPTCETVFSPETRQGTLLVFPSDVKHFVTMHNRDSLRATISGNIGIKYKIQGF